jgi:hypothetical protein
MMVPGYGRSVPEMVGGILVKSNDLISPEYLAEQRRLHAMANGYGGNGRKWASTVLRVATEYDCWSVLDYGCGQGSLARALQQDGRLSVREYDPAIDGKDARPSFADLVCCTDVLEHIEHDKLPAVLAHIRSLARKVVFFVVALDSSGKTLSDGRNAHLIQEAPLWWADRVVEAGFTVASVSPDQLEIRLKPQKRFRRWVAVVRP